MIMVTRHALHHWTNRCGQPDYGDLHRTRNRLLYHLRNGRMASDEEATVAALWLIRAKYLNHPKARSLSRDNVIVCDQIGIGFVLALEDGVASVTTTLVMATAWRHYHSLRPRAIRLDVRRQIDMEASELQA